VMNKTEYRSFQNETFAALWRQLQSEVHSTAVDHGFWSQVGGIPPNPAEKIALMHSELSEVLEALRGHNGRDDHIPNFKAVEVELADVIMRIMNFAEYYGYNVVEALVAKADYNKARPYMHGKAF